MLWADGRRLRNGLAAAALLAALGAWYAHLAMQKEVGWREYTSDPAFYDGAQLTFPLWVVTRVVDEHRYEISKVVKDVPIEGDARGLKVGDTVSVIADFSAARTVGVARIVEVHHLRPWKEGLGVAGVLAWLAAMPVLFRWRRGRVEERFGG